MTAARSRLVLVAVLTVYDAATTALLLSTVRGAYEANPIVAATIGTAGLAGGLAARVAVGVGVAVGLYGVRNHPHNRWGSRPLVGAAAALTAVAVWNTALIVSTGAPA